MRIVPEIVRPHLPKWWDDQIGRVRTGALIGGSAMLTADLLLPRSDQKNPSLVSNKDAMMVLLTGGAAGIAIRGSDSANAVALGWGVLAGTASVALGYAALGARRIPAIDHLLHTTTPPAGATGE